MAEKYAWKEREYVRKQTSRNGEKKKELSERQKQYSSEYHKEKYRCINLKFNAEKEKEMIDWLDSQESLKGYLMNLLVKEANSANMHLQK